MKINSYWNFERAEKGFKETDITYEIPKHKSEDFIDIDIVRGLMFVYKKDSQKAVQDYTLSADECIDMLDNIGNLFNFRYNSKEVVRILFDFSNNLLKVKTNDGTELYKIIDELEKYNSKIYKVLGIETFDAKEIDNDLQAIILLHQFKDLSLEEKIEFMKSYMLMKEYITQLESEVETSRQILSNLFKDDNNEFSN